MPTNIEVLQQNFDKLTPDRQEQFVKDNPDWTPPAWWKPPQKAGEKPPATLSLTAPPVLTPPEPRPVRDPLAGIPITGWIPGTEYESAEPKNLEPEHLEKLAKGMGVNLGLTTAGGVLGSMVGAPNLGILAGSLGARQYNKWKGYEEPGLLGDLLAMTPAIPVGMAGGQKALRLTKAGQAIRSAEQQGVDYEAQVAVRQAEYNAKVAEQAAAAKEAQALRTRTVAEGGFAPDVPSRALYNDFAKLHHLTPADPAAANEIGLEVYREAAPPLFPQQAPEPVVPRRQAGFLAPDPQPIPPPPGSPEWPLRKPGAVTANPQRKPTIETLANEVAQLPEEGTTIGTIYDYMQKVQPLRSHDSARVREWANRLYDGLAESMESAPGAMEDLLPAKAAYRREKALSNLGQVVGRATREGLDAQPRVNGQSLLNWHHDLSQPGLDPKQRLIRGSFSREEWEQLGRNIKTLAATAPIPKPGSAGAPLPALGTPGAPTFPAELKPLTLRNLEAEAVGGAAAGTLAHHLGAPPVLSGAIGTGVASAEAINYGLSKLLLQPNVQPILRRILHADGTIDPRAMALFNQAWMEERQRQDAAMKLKPPTLQDIVTPIIRRLHGLPPEQGQGQ